MATLMIATKLAIAMQDSLLLFESSKTGWKTRESLKGTSPQCVAFDPSNPNRVYCGTFGNGLWKTDDSGGSWERSERRKKKTVVMIVYPTGHR